MLGLLGWVFFFFSLGFGAITLEDLVFVYSNFRGKFDLLVLCCFDSSRKLKVGPDQASGNY